MQLDEEDADEGEDPESNDPDGIEGVTEELMVWLARAVKDAQMDEKHCYHCSSPEHFIHNCGGDGDNEGSPDPSNGNKHHKEPPKGGSGGIKSPL